MTRAHRDPIAELRRVMRERADHAQLIGISSGALLKGGIQIRWRDYLAHEWGVLTSVPWGDTATVACLLNEIGALKARERRAA